MNAPFRVPTSTRTPLIPYSFRSVATVVAGSLPERATRSGSEAIGGGRGGQFHPRGGGRCARPSARGGGGGGGRGGGGRRARRSERRGNAESVSRRAAGRTDPVTAGSASLPWSRLRRVERGKQLSEPLQLRCIVRHDVRIVGMALGVVLMNRLGRAKMGEPADLGHDGPGEDPPRREVGDGGLRSEPLSGVPVEHDGAVFRTGIRPLPGPLG